MLSSKGLISGAKTLATGVRQDDFIGAWRGIVGLTTTILSGFTFPIQSILRYGFGERYFLIPTRLFLAVAVQFLFFYTLKGIGFIWGIFYVGEELRKFFIFLDIAMCLHIARILIEMLLQKPAYSFSTGTPIFWIIWDILRSIPWIKIISWVLSLLWILMRKTSRHIPWIRKLFLPGKTLKPISRSSKQLWKKVILPIWVTLRSINWLNDTSVKLILEPLIVLISSIFVMRFGEPSIGAYLFIGAFALFQLEFIIFKQRRSLYLDHKDGERIQVGHNPSHKQLSVPVPITHNLES